MSHPIHTSNRRRADKLWLLLGGEILPVRRTGEKFYIHTKFPGPIRTNGRRDDVPVWATSRTCSHFAGLEMLTGFEGCAVYPGMIVT